MRPSFLRCGMLWSGGYTTDLGRTKTNYQCLNQERVCFIHARGKKITPYWNIVSQMFPRAKLTPQWGWRRKWGFWRDRIFSEQVSWWCAGSTSLRWWARDSLAPLWKDQSRTWVSTAVPLGWLGVGSRNLLQGPSLEPLLIWTQKVGMNINCSHRILCLCEKTALPSGDTPKGSRGKGSWHASLTLTSLREKVEVGAKYK